MRTCPNCGHMLSEKDTICFKCGMQLSQLERNNNMPNNMPQQPMGRPAPGRPGPGRPNQPQYMMNNGRMPMNNMNNGGGDKSKIIYLILGILVILGVVAAVIVIVTKNSRLDDDDEEPNKVKIVEPEDPDDPEDPEKPIEPEPPVEDPEDPVDPEQPDPEEPEQPDPEPEEPETPTPGKHETPVGGTVQLKENEHLVKNNGYSYAVPNEYTEKDYGVQGVDLLNYKKTKEMIIAINIGEMENLKKTLPVIKQMYVDLGATVTDIKVSTISDIEVICVEMKKNGQNLIIGIAAAAPGEIFQVAVYNPVTNQYDYNILTEGINIIKTAVKNGSNAVNT